MFWFSHKLNKNGILIKSPHRFEEVGGSFLISGYISKEWFRRDEYFSYSIYLDLVNIKGKIISAGHLKIQKPKFNKNKNIYKFFSPIYFSSNNIYFIKESQGLMNIKLAGYNKGQVIYIPIIVKQFVPKTGVDPQFKKRHGNIKEFIKKNEEDCKKFYEELEKIENRRILKSGISKAKYEKMNQFVLDDELAGGLFCALENSKGFNNDYPFQEEDLAEEKLRNEYKDAIEWEERLGACVGRFNGYEFMVFSDDHGKHFHVIHRGRGINARFSFPEIKLLNYKNFKNSINSKEEKKIINFLNQQDNLKRLEMEFKRREL